MQGVVRVLGILVFLNGICVSLASTCGGKQKSVVLLDITKELINKAKDWYPTFMEDNLTCGQKEKSLAFLDVAVNMLNQVEENFPVCKNVRMITQVEQSVPVCKNVTMITQVEQSVPVCPEPACPQQQIERPTDCADALRSGRNESGVYSIWPRNRIYSDKPLSVYCDMDTDGGGWTVIQRRGEYSTPKDYFYKGWEDYKKGFGNITEEFWIGNDNIYAISNQGNYSIRFDLKDHRGNIGYAVYDIFWIDGESANYILHIDGYSGNVGDAMEHHNGMKFSTKDRDNDNHPRISCTVNNKGSWWYNSCSNANLNGVYEPGIETPEVVTWYTWKSNVGLSSVEIKIRS